MIMKNHREWGDESIPTITFKDLVKYLGIEIQPDGTVRLPRTLWNKYLENLSKAHLNPIQELDAIREVIVAKIKYQLTQSDHGFEEASKLKRLISKYVKKILQLYQR